MKFSLPKFFSKVTAARVGNGSAVVGIDIGSSSVKVVELDRKDDYVVLTTYGELQTGPYVEEALGNAVNLPAEKRVEALVDVLREADVNANKGVLALPMSVSFTTVVPLSVPAGETLDSRVKVEARKYIPLPLSEVSLEWSELPAVQEGNDEVKEVLIAAVQTDSYRQMNELLAAVELSSQPTEVELFCTQRAADTEEDCFAVIDFGAESTKLYLFKSGAVRKVHRVFAGGSQVTDLIAKESGMSFAEAENQKRNNSSAASDAQYQAHLARVYDRPIQEMQRALQHFETRAGITIDTVLLSGGASSGGAMKSYVADRLGRNVSYINGFNNVAYPAFMEDTLSELAPSFTVALGAALRVV